jgi:DNA invertase Pin-like site-specific DNA recombinase
MSIRDDAPRVYSYVRFSTPEQAMGDSERRQLEAAKKWADRTSRRLDDSLTPDRGLSGYRGAHRTKGSLGKFLKSVKEGRIPPGSVLLVENLDRLGREGPSKTLRKTIFELWDKGITLQTFSPEEAYPPGCENDPKFIVLILYLQRAWEDSKRKSDLAKSNWAQKQRKARDERHIVTGSVPAWVEVEYDHTDPQRPRAVGRKLIPDAADAVRLIFDLKVKGLGYGTIERKLNAEAAWKPPLKKGGGRPRKDGTPAVRQLTRGWRISYIKKILVNRAVLGEYQPFVETDKGRVPVGDPIPGYFPAVVKPEVFHAVQTVLTANRGKGGRTAKAANLLAHVAKCAYCGGPMAFCDRGAKGDRWLICDNGRRGVHDEGSGEPLCRRHSMKYAECEQLILDGCHDLKPERVLPDPDEHARTCENLRQRIHGKSAELSSIDRQSSNLTDQIARTDEPAIRDRYEAKLKELNERLKVLKDEKDDAEAELSKIEGGVQSFAAWQRNFRTLKKALKGGDVELRVKLRTHLRELIDKIEVFASGGQRYEPFLKDDTGDGEPLYYFGGDHDHPIPQSQAEPFIAYVNGRLATREGRFIRVYFKTLPELPFDLAPEGSLAEGLQLTRPDLDVVDAWDVIAPTLKRLWHDYESDRAAKRRIRQPVQEIRS